MRPLSRPRHKGVGGGWGWEGVGGGRGLRVGRHPQEEVVGGVGEGPFSIGCGQTGPSQVISV